METEVTIKLRIKDKEVELTLQELKELKETLKDLIGIVEKKEYIPYPYYVPYYPWKYDERAPIIDSNFIKWSYL